MLAVSETKRNLGGRNLVLFGFCAAATRARRFGPTLLFVLVTLVALSVFRGQMPRFYPHWVPNSTKIYLPLLGILARDPTQARRIYHFRFHHHPSDPFLYKELNALSLEDVVGYQPVIESICHSMNGGHVEKKVIARDTEYVSVL